MSKIGEMNLTLNVAAAEGIMTVKRENAELRARVAVLEATEKVKAKDVEAMQLAWGRAVQHAADNNKRMLGFAPEMLQGPIDEIIVLHQKFGVAQARVAVLEEENVQLLERNENLARSLRASLEAGS